MLEIKRIIYKSPYPHHPHISSSYTKKGNSYTIQLIKLFCDRFLVIKFWGNPRLFLIDSKIRKSYFKVKKILKYCH